MINIIKYKKIPFIISSALFIVSLVLIFTIGLKPSIDFTGGSLLEVSFSGNRPTVAEIKTSLSSLEINLGEVVVQPSEDKNVMLRTRFLNEDEHQSVLEGLRASFANDTDKVLEERIEVIGPSISAHMKSRAIYAAMAVIIAIVVYVAYAFRKVSRPVQSWKYGIAAVIALLHDVTITMGIFVLLGKYMNVEVGIPFVVACLTILGYSVNDTIVVFDRIRENLIKRSADNFSEMVNLGVNETLSRSINTSGTTLLVLFALFIFGGESIKYFALALIIGIGFGTYSSIFLASPLLVVWEELRHRSA